MSYNKLLKKEYQKANKEKIALYQKEYRAKNKEYLTARDKERKQSRRQEIVEYQKKYRQKHRDHLLAQQKIYQQKNKSRISQMKRQYFQGHKEQSKLSAKKYRENNIGKNAKYIKDRKKIDIQFRLATNLRSRLGTTIRGNYKSGSAVRDLGCTIPELKFYLEGKFQDGMSWDNWSVNGWHIDHIIPLSFFDLTNRQQFLQAVHYTNLQPMWAVDNIKKSAKLPAIIKTV